MKGTSSVVLGLSYGHGDSSAALVVNGQLVAAAEEERFVRVKHYALFPTHAIHYCLTHAKIQPSDVETVAIARRPLNQLRKKIGLLVRHPQLLSARSSRRDHAAPTQNLKEMLAALKLDSARLVRVEHHLAHMLSTRHLGGDEPTAFLSFDGLGDFVSAAIGRSHGNQVDILDRVVFPHSVGFFYTAMTQFLGFPHFGDEFKVMGLSSYGQPKYLDKVRTLIHEAEPFGFRLNLEAFPILKHPMKFRIEKAQPSTQPFYDQKVLTDLIGMPARKPEDALTEHHWDLAKSVQVRFEEVGNHLLAQLHRRVPTETLALSGGCAHNSVWVGKIPAVSLFRKIWVAPAAHDAGIAVGAAFHEVKGTVRAEGGHWALMGPSHLESEQRIDPSTVPPNVKKNDPRSESDLLNWMVEQLCQQQIIGLFHGRMEFGPRALGSRSILADPRDRNMRDRLNERVKHRETFRPFAASVLHEYQENWFENSFFSPGMEAVFDVKPNVREKISAVVHADNTCRIQSVTQETQPFYWGLIEAFRKKTGVPMLVNTSFNDSEPIVCTPQDAFRCFINSDLDHLVIGADAYSKIRVGQEIATRKLPEPDHLIIS